MSAVTHSLQHLSLEEHGRKVSIVCRNSTNMQFADDIDAYAEEEQELEALVLV